MGKPQHADTPTAVAPAAKFADSRASFRNPEDVDEIQDQLKAIEKKRQIDQGRATKVSAFLKDNFFRTDKTWPFLYWKPFAMQLSVRYYFPRKNLAIDQFKAPTKTDLLAIEFKKKVLKEQGIKYFPMFAENRLMDLAEFL